MYGAPGRVAFFGAGPAWLLYVLGLMALALFIWGLGRRVHAAPSRSTIITWLLLAPLWRAAPVRALLLAAAWWPLLLMALGSLLWQAHVWLHPFLRGAPYLAFASVMDILGALFTGACGLLFLARVIFWRRGPGLRSWWAPLMGFVVGLSGLVLEAGRLGATRPGWAWWEPVGMWLGDFWLGGASDRALFAVWWVHAGLALAFLALLPWARLDRGGPCNRDKAVAD